MSTSPRLTARELEILGCIEHQANVPIVSLARQLKMKAPSVRYTIASLIDRKVIAGRVPFVSLTRLGYTEYVIFFSPGAVSKEKKNEILRIIFSFPGTTWMARLGGEYQIAVSIAATSILEVQKLLFKIGSLHAFAFRQKAVSVRLSFAAFGRKYLRPTTSRNPEFQIHADTSQSIVLDDTDRKILSVLAAGSSSSLRETAQQTGIPFATLDRRIKRLERDQVICGYLYRLNLIGLPILAYRVLIQVKCTSKPLRDMVYEFAKRHPQVLHFVECFGVWDYELGVEVGVSEEVNALVDNLYMQFADEIDRISTVQVFQHLKYSGYPF